MGSLALAHMVESTCAQVGPRSPQASTCKVWLNKLVNLHNLALAKHWHEMQGSTTDHPESVLFIIVFVKSDWAGCAALGFARNGLFCCQLPCVLFIFWLLHCSRISVADGFVCLDGWLTCRRGINTLSFTHRSLWHPHICMFVARLSSVAFSLSRNQ